MSEQWRVESGGYLSMIVDDADSIVDEGIEQEVAEQIVSDHADRAAPAELSRRSVFVEETRPRSAPLPEGARKYIRDVPIIATVIHKGVPEREAQSML